MLKYQEIQSNSVMMQTEIQRKDAEIRIRDVEIEALRSDMSKMQVTAHHLSPKQVDY